MTISRQLIQLITNWSLSGGSVYTIHIEFKSSIDREIGLKGEINWGKERFYFLGIGGLPENWNCNLELKTGKQKEKNTIPIFGNSNNKTKAFNRSKIVKILPRNGNKKVTK